MAASVIAKHHYEVGGAQMGRPAIENNPRNPKQINQNVLDSSKLDKKTAEKKTTTCDKIKFVAKIAFSILLSLTLFWINPALFFVSFVVGVAFSKTVQKAVDKIKIFMEHYRWPAVGASALLAAMVFPVFLATGSVIWSAYMGSYLSQRAQGLNK